MDIKPIYNESRIKKPVTKELLDNAVRGVLIYNDKFAIRLGKNHSKNMYYIARISSKVQRIAQPGCSLRTMRHLQKIT